MRTCGYLCCPELNQIIGSGGLACNPSHGALAALGLKQRQILHPRDGASAKHASFRPLGFEALFHVPSVNKIGYLVTFPTTPPPLARALAERNYDSPTPVQTAVLADAVAGHDLLVSAQTGSGKTVAYGLAIAKNILDDAGRLGRAAAPLALIVAP